MFYTIYKTTNILNGKYYLGKHQTKNLDDGYIGSGLLVNRAFKKHGKENFVTEILHVFDNEEHMNLAEKILVVPDLTNYNLCPGGKGGFGYINNHPKSKEWKAANARKINALGLNGRGPKPKPKGNCLNCKNLIISREAKLYCSRSCSASSNNRKRKLT